MAKNFGLDNLLKSTTDTQATKTNVATKKNTQAIAEKKEQEDVKIINSNIPLCEEHHWKLRTLALEKKTTLRGLMQEIVAFYLEHHDK